MNKYDTSFCLLPEMSFPDFLPDVGIGDAFFKGAQRRQITLRNHYYGSSTDDRCLMPEPIADSYLKYRNFDRKGRNDPSSAMPVWKPAEVVKSVRGGFGGMGIRYSYGRRKPQPDATGHLLPAPLVSVKTYLLVGIGSKSRRRR